MAEKTGGRELRAVFFDAVGTLICPREAVGETYARFGVRHGLYAGPEQLEQGFRLALRQLSPASAGGQKAWWRRVVAESFASAGVPSTDHPRFGDCFEELYAHYATAGAWSVYGEVCEVLVRLQSAGIACWVVSNFDERLPVVLDLLDLSRFFEGVVFSAEVGVAKPETAIFIEAASRAGCQPAECLHVGDDPQADWQGARSAGLRVFELQRPGNSLVELIKVPGIPVA